MGLDFLEINMKLKESKSRTKKDILEVYPTFLVGRTKDIMIRGSSVYGVWSEVDNKWLTDETDIIYLIDSEIGKKAEELEKQSNGQYDICPMYLRNTDTRMIKKWHEYVQKDMPDIYTPLDSNILFDNQKLKREDYATKTLPYHLSKKEPIAYQKLTSVLYSQDELMKIEWCIGAVLSGDSKNIQKFLVITGDAGSGKSTMLNIMQMLFEGYYISFDSKAIVGNNQFGLSQFKSNPRIAIEHDGNLSRIWDNSKLNSLVSHEEMTIDEKYRSPYNMKFDTFLVIASNLPVEITDAKSGLTRRIIDAEPTGNKVSFEEYIDLMEQIKFELGSIANHCLELYLSNKHYYDKYRPTKQIAKTYKFYDYIDYMATEFEEKDFTTLDYAWGKYKKYVDLSGIKFPYDRVRFKTELMEFFKDFYPRHRYEGTQYRNCYVGYIKDRLASSKNPVVDKMELPNWLKLGAFEKCLLDEELADRPAQYAKDDGTPFNAWDYVTTLLAAIITSRTHYVRVPENYIVIDFDLRDEKGEKSLEKNLEAARNFPPTYAEVSQSGNGLHLHYIYDGDVSKLSSIYDVNIEVKVYRGKAALRRKLTLCNNVPIATISSGLPLKEETKVVNKESVKSEKSLRKLMLRNLNKEIMGATKPSIDFMKKILDDAYNSGLHYDISDMYPAVETFAMHSSHNAEYCVKQVSQMKFKSDEPSEDGEYSEDAPILYFDVEVFPNLFVVCHKVKGEGTVTKMINPTPEEIEPILNYRLVGFNNRRYDNHILYAKTFGGYNNEQLFKLSQKIINNSANAMFGEAYNLSYADIYEYSSKKQSLKKWEIELGIFHLENSYPWDQPIAEEHWEEIAEYCANDVIATEKVAEACAQDFVAREVLAKLSGLTVGHTTRQHATKIIFGNDKNPELVYTDLSEMFPGYEFKDGKSSYMGEDPGEGGYVYSEPGVYYDVALLDIASMHPNSIRNLNLFGEYTQRFSDILDARLAIKHHDYEKARTMLDGALAEFLSTDEDADRLAYALKIVINSIYGFTTANFDNPFKDPRNVDNIVAKRGALFMINLKHEVQKRGYTVAHIKTDSIKIPNADEEIISFVTDYGKQYGYTFEHEATYEKICLVNDAVYIAKYADGNHKFKLSTGEKIETPWTATGTQFQIPYVFKTLFSKTPIEFNDMCETKSVTSSLYLDFNENLPEGEHDYHFVGRVGKFTPIKPGCGGALLMREKDGKYYAATGTKGYRWMESNIAQNFEDDIDLSYYRALVDDARASIEEYCDVEEFIR